MFLLTLAIDASCNQTLATWVCFKAWDSKMWRNCVEQNLRPSRVWIMCSSACLMFLIDSEEFFTGCCLDVWPYVMLLSQTCPALLLVLTNRKHTSLGQRTSSNILLSYLLTCCKCCSTRTPASLWVQAAEQTCCQRSEVHPLFDPPTVWPHVAAGAQPRDAQSPVCPLYQGNLPTTHMLLFWNEEQIFAEAMWGNNKNNSDDSL